MNNEHNCNSGRKTSVTYRILSNNRSAIMGVAIILVLLFHFLEDYVNDFGGNESTLNMLYSIFGSVGVELFLLMAGLGLYYSLKRDNNIRRFYIKRASRILVPYFLLAIPAWAIYDILSGKNFVTYLKDLFFVSFFESGNTWFWYVLLVAFLYIIYPLIFAVISKGKTVFGGVTFASVIILCVIISGIALFENNSELFDNIEIALLRIPVFLIGCIFGRLTYENKPISPIWVLFIVLAIAISCVDYCEMIPYQYFRYVLLVKGVSLLFIFAALFECFKLSKLKCVLNWFGGITLELYLTHVMVRKIFKKFLNLATSDFFYYVIMIITSMLISIILKYVSDVIIGKIKRSVA